MPVDSLGIILIATGISTPTTAAAGTCTDIVTARTQESRLCWCRPLWARWTLFTRHRVKPIQSVKIGNGWSFKQVLASR
jgi:hypothetical protein